MAIVYCGRGHYYDNEKYSQCPYCGLSGKMHGNPDTANTGRAEDEGRTVAIREEERGGEETVSLENENAAPDDGKTVSLQHTADVFAKLRQLDPPITPSIVYCLTKTQSLVPCQ